MTFSLDISKCKSRCDTNEKSRAALWLSNKNSSLTDLKNHIEHCEKCLRLLRSYHGKRDLKNLKNLKITPLVRRQIEDRKLDLVQTKNIEKTLNFLKFAKWMQQLEGKQSLETANLVKEIKAFYQVSEKASQEQRKLRSIITWLKDFYDVYKVSSAEVQRESKRELAEAKKLEVEKRALEQEAKYMFENLVKKKDLIQSLLRACQKQNLDCRQLSSLLQSMG
jgi:hypothetical protein